VRVTIQSQLAGNTFRQTCVDSRVFRRKFADDIITLVRFLNLTEFFSISSQEVVQFSNQAFHGRNEFYQSFRNQYSTEVVSLCSTVSYHFSDVSHYIVQRHIFSFYFFRNDTHVRLYLQSTFQCDMRSRTTHQLDEVPVFTCRVTVTLDVTDYFRISLTCCIETERSFNHIVLQVTVDCFRATDYLYTVVLSCIVFSQYTSVCVRVVTTNDNQCFDAKFFDDFISLFELAFCFQFRTSGTDDIETTCVTVFVDNISSQFHIIVIYQTTRTQNKTI